MVAVKKAHGSGYTRWLVTLNTLLLLGFIELSDLRTSAVAAFYGDIEMNKTAKQYDVPSVVFPHWAHRVQFTCQVCHPAIFPMKSGTREILMEKMAAHGAFCLSCHNGEIAWKPINCARCHRGKEEVLLVEGQNSATLPAPGPPFAKENSDPRRLLKDFPRDNVGQIDWIETVRQALISPRSSLAATQPKEGVVVPDIPMLRTGSMPPVVFPHASHALWLDCQNCHPAIFIARKTANPVSMEKLWAGQYCGECHGKVAFPLSQCARCHPQGG